MDQFRFSVIVASYNRPAALRNCLQSLERQNYPESKFEVIVVDDGSCPPIQGSIQKELTNIHVSLIRNSKNLGPAATRNRGAEFARGQFLAFTDDDCMPDENWLAELESILVNASSTAVGGRIIVKGRNLYSAASHAILDAAYEYYNESQSDARFVACANMAVPAKEYREMGGFLPEFRISEDREFCARWLRHGHQLMYAPDAIVSHQSQTRLRSFLRCHFNYGRGAYQYRSLQAKTLKRRLELEPSAFYWRLMLHSLSRQAGLWGIGISLLSVVSQMASLMGFLSERRKAKRLWA